MYLSSPVQNDHPASERKTADPAEQGQRVPPEIYPAVFLKIYIHFPAI